MTPERHRRIGEIYHEALDLEPDRRESFLREACSGDTDLLDEVCSLLAAHEDDPDFLARPLVPTDVRDQASTRVSGHGRVCPRCGIRYPDAVLVCTRDGEVLDVEPEGLVGVTLDGLFQIEALIGKGGMGIVYRARHLLLDDLVAIKVLPPEAVRSPEWLRRFQREGRAARRFRHPSAVTVHELRIPPDGPAYMVLEYVEGPTLRAEMRRRGVLPVADVMTILEQIADVLDAAHAAGVVHRDVKPENVILSGPPDGPWCVKLLDLGIAKLLESDDSTIALTAAGQIIGTPAYMSPEQWGEPQRDANRDVDPRTDVYSVGVLAFELFAGRLPFVATTREGWRHLHVSTAPPSMDEAARPVPSGVEAVIRRALSKDRADRHATAGAFLAAIRSALLTKGVPRSSGPVAANVVSSGTAWGGLATKTGGGDTGAIPLPANNLLPEATSFVGRSGQTEDVERLVKPGSVVTLTGMGGLGKTRLALRVAHAALAARRDEVWFVELAALSDPALVVDTVARVVGAVEAADSDQLETLCVALAPRCALIVLDNCEHLLGACRRVAGALVAAGPNLRVLATSREPLGLPEEIVWRVPALKVPETATTECDAVRLFVERARLARPSFELTSANTTIVIDLCRKLEGIPLAIELAAARVRVLSVGQLAERMANRFTLLRGGPAGAPARQQALRAALDWSYDLLDEGERVVLRRLSVFSGGWTIEAAEAVCSGDGIVVDDVLDHLASLVDKSFVAVAELRGEARYGVVESIRQYAAERLEESGEAPRLVDRHRAWFFALAWRTEGAAAHDLSRCFDRIEADVDNVRTALSASLESDPEAGLGAVVAVDRFWRARGFASEGLGWIETFVGRAPGAPDGLLATALRNGGYLANLMEDYTRAATLLEESVRHARQAGDPLVLATSLKSLSSSLSNIGDFDRAEELATESLRLSVDAGDRKSVVAAKDRLASVAWQRDDMERANDLWSECLSYFREVGDRLNCAVVLHNLARTARIVGDAEAHERFARECADGFRELGYESLVGHGLVEVGLAAAARGALAEAVAAYEEALSRSRGGGDQIGAFAAIEAVACLAAERGETRRALRLAAFVDETARRLKMTDPKALVAWVERRIEPARASVGEAEAEAERLAAEGSAMSSDQAVECALEALRAIRVAAGH